MLLQVPQVGEAIPTFVTHEGFLAGVGLLVGLQAVALVEAAAAHVAGVRFLSRVDPLVSAQVAGVAKTFSACAAAERFLSGMNDLLEDKKLTQICKDQAESPDLFSYNKLIISDVFVVTES